jgi:tRNA-dihydrouridine synthase
MDKGSLMLAPMAELSHRALRELIEGFFDKGGSLPPGSAFFPGLRPGKHAPAAPLSGDTPQRPEYYTEMLSAPALLAGGPFEKWYLDGGPCPERLVYQLLGADETRLVKAAAFLDRRECLGIDINMGCPAPAITRTGAGIRWMEDIDRAGRLVGAIRKVTKKRLSVKVRLGPKTARSAEQADSRGFDYLLRFCRRLEAEGLDLIILHPRKADEKLKRRARWELVDRLRQELSIPAAGNGDIASVEELRDKAAAGPVMVGRLAVKEPWVFAGAAGPETGAAGPETGAAGSSLEATGLRFLELLSRYQPPEFHVSRARRFFRYYCSNVTWAEFLRNRINREETLPGIARVFSSYCREER